MGVSIVVNYKIDDGQTPQQALELLHNRIEQLGAEKTSTYSIDCELCQANPSKLPNFQRTMAVMHNTEYPASCFSILDTGTCLVADTVFNALLGKLKDFYPVRQNSKMETRGQRYELGDFIIKIGSTVVGSSASFKGILVEVEYLPCSVAGECYQLLKEFMYGFLGCNSDTPTNYIKSKLDADFSPSDIMMQYNELYSNMRKQQG